VAFSIRPLPNKESKIEALLSMDACYWTHPFFFLPSSAAAGKAFDPGYIIEAA
jgi:hypothetical protein